MNEQINQHPVVYYPQTTYQPQFTGLGFLYFAIGAYFLFIVVSEVFRSVKGALS